MPPRTKPLPCGIFEAGTSYPHSDRGNVLTKRFGLGDDEERTYREIGDQYQLSRECIRQIQNSALDKLKRALEREHRGHVEM